MKLNFLARKNHVHQPSHSLRVAHHANVVIYLRAQTTALCMFGCLLNFFYFFFLFFCSVYQVSKEKNKKKDKSPCSFTANDFFYDTKGKNGKRNGIKHEKSVKTHMLQRSTTLITVARCKVQPLNFVWVPFRLDWPSCALNAAELYVLTEINGFLLLSFSYPTHFFQWTFLFEPFFPTHLVAH